MTPPFVRPWIAGPALLGVLLLSGVARAQAQPPADQPDLAVDAATRARIVDSLTVQMERRYVFPDRGAEAARAIRRRFAAHQYDRITSSKEFADSLTAHLQAVTHDLHVRVHYRHEPLPPPSDDGPAAEEEIRRQHEEMRLRNYGFEKLQRLPGNVGYLDLRMFSGDPEAQATAVGAMQFLSGADALIVDLRRNGGGSPAMIATLLSYFVAADDRLHFNDFYQREGDRTEQWWTSPYVPGPRRVGRPLYVLTSGRTASAAEEFSYDVQTHELGTLIGEVTAGGANPGRLFRLNEHFGAFIATGRAINPRTKTNWEGVGVKPDVAVPATDALREAHVAAVQKLLAGDVEPSRRALLERALEQARQTPADPGEDFRRSRPRR